MKNGIFKWSLITILILSSPLIYTELQGYISLHVAFPAYAALSTKSFAALSTIFIGSGAICAILTATVVALPSAYLAREKSKMVCIVLVLVTQAIPVCTFFQQPMIKSFTAVVFAGDLIAFIAFVFIFAHIGLRLVQRDQGAEY
jgi:hypothetical protein